MIRKALLGILVIVLSIWILTQIAGLDSSKVDKVATYGEIKYRSEILASINVLVAGKNWTEAQSRIDVLQEERHNAHVPTASIDTQLVNLELAVDVGVLQEEIRSIPASNLEENLDGYVRLSRLDPSNSEFQERATLYRNRINVREEQERLRLERQREAERRRLEAERLQAERELERQRIAEAQRRSGGRGYINSRGQWVPSPRRSPSAPAGASAQCRDGTYSFSRSRRGTCSHHGGVARWL